MKILYVSTVLSTVNSFLIPHLVLLQREGHEVGIACNPSDSTSELADQYGIPIYPISFQRNPFSQMNRKAIKEIRSLVEKERFQVVHVHTPVASFITRFALRNFQGVKIFYTAHGFHFFKGAPLKNWLLYYPLERVAARWTDCLITMNGEDYYAAIKMKLRKSGMVFQVPGVGVDIGKFSPLAWEEKRRLRMEYGYDDEDFLLIYVGELSARKNQGMLFEVLQLLEDRIPRLKLLLVGDGDMEEKYKNLARRMKIEDLVEFLGYREDIPQLLALSDVLVSTSRQEGLPVNVMEGMAVGLPLVVTDCRGNRDLVEDGKNGFLIPIGAPKSFASAIEKLYVSSSLRQRFSKANLMRIQDYRLDIVLGKMREIYRKRLGEDFSRSFPTVHQILEKRKI